MTTKTIAIQIPIDIQVSDFEAKMILAGELYERGKITLGQGAKLVGLTKRSFIEILGKFGYSIFSQSVDDLLRDIENA